MNELFSQLKTLRSSPREMWIVALLLKATLAASYFTLASMLVAYFEFEYGYSDTDATWLYGVFGCGISLFSLFTGPLIDAIDIRRSLVLGSLFSAVGMVMLGLSFQNGFVFMLAMYVFIPMGVSLGLPVCEVGTDRYTYAANNSFVYSLGYASMNAGGGLGSLLFYAVTRAIDSEHADGEVPFHGRELSARRLMIIVCGVISAITGLLAALTVGDVFVDEHGHVRPKPPPESGSASERIFEHRRYADRTEIVVLEPSDRWNVRETIDGTLHWLCNDLPKTLRDVDLLRMSFFTLLTLFPRHVFQQLNTTLILYLYRVFGKNAPVALFVAINPNLTCILTPLAGLLTARFDIYRVIIAGSFISSCGVLMLAIGTPSYATVAVSLAVFTVGEAIYSPQITKYIMKLSPKDKKGQYSALSGAPIFLGKIFVALLSGDLLETRCPADNVNVSRCNTIWSYIAAVSFVGPLALFLCYRFIHTSEIQLRFSQDDLKARIVAVDQIAHDGNENNQ